MQFVVLVSWPPCNSARPSASWQLVHSSVTVELSSAGRVARALGTRRAVLLEDVLAGSPAQAAGLREGDVVLDVDGEPVTDSQAVLNAIGARRPGEELLLRVMRDGELFDVTVVLSRRR